MYTPDPQKTTVVANANGDLVALTCPRRRSSLGEEPMLTLRIAPRGGAQQLGVSLSVSETRELGAALLKAVAYTESASFNTIDWLGLSGDPVGVEDGADR